MMRLCITLVVATALVCSSVVVAEENTGDSNEQNESQPKENSGRNNENENGNSGNENRNPGAASGENNEAGGWWKEGRSTDTKYGDFLIDESVTCICDKLPANDDVSFYTLSGCSAGDSSPACQGGADVDLDILKVHIQCFRDACNAQNDNLKDRGLRRCVATMRDVIENFLQFSVPRSEQQVKRSCDCDYENVDESAFDNKVERVKHIANCDITSGGSRVKDCLNAEQVIRSRGCCKKSGPEQDQCFKQVAEVMKWNRIYKYCSIDLKSMLAEEAIGNLTCKESSDYKNSLTSSCDANCLFNFHEGWSEDDEAAYTDHDDYTSRWVCNEFPGYSSDGTEFIFQGDSIYYKGRREAWRQMVDICVEYTSTGSLPQCMKASPYPRPFLTESQFTDIIAGCCTRTNEEYLQWQATHDDDKRSTFGLDEAICLNNYDVMTDFGFSSGLLRSLIKTKTGDCWDCIPGKCSPNPGPQGEDWGIKCTNGDLVQPNICDDDVVTPKSFYWFLKYLKTKEDKAYALKACAAGAKFGKSATALAGISIGVESQMEALSSRYPNPYKTLAFVAMHHCGVTAALEANNYYRNRDGDGDNCNKDAFPLDLKW
jgi:hypothetical protein